MPRLVVKKNGVQEIYSPNKVKQTLKRLNVDELVINYVLSELEKLPDKVTTTQLYQKIFRILSDKDIIAGIKYNLKNAIFLLGPSGYPFEKFFAKVLNFYGYQTTTNVFLNGSCLVYEIDIVASKDNEQFIIECKYHQQFYSKNDVKTCLYVYGRYLDIQKVNPYLHCWLATNTKFTESAIDFAKCYNIKLTSWNYPDDYNLVTLIENWKLYPVTILTNCNTRVFKEFVKADIILLKDLLSTDERFIRKITNLNNREITNIIQEAKLVLGLN
ncbi:MAG: hypothetical protein KatS3mg097_157 [Candidatus Parcubacteria bacterium]|nr:MAG: hypothetical protein KatS3mg097_157 [Candidatus Parcubacteria bacterium]